MVDLAEIQAAYYMVAATGVLVAAIYYVLNMRATQRNLKANLETRQAQLLMNLYHIESSEEAQRNYCELMNMKWTDYDDFEKKYGSDNNPSNFAKRYSSWKFYDSIGLLIKSKLLDPLQVYEILGEDCIYSWNKFGEIITRQRELYSPESQINFEFLFNEMRRVRESRGFSAEVPRNFLSYVKQ